MMWNVIKGATSVSIKEKSAVVALPGFVLDGDVKEVVANVKTTNRSAIACGANKAGIF